MTPFMGFLPDVDPVTPGVLVDVENIVPTTKGFRAGFSAQSAGLSAVSDDANSLYVAVNLAGTKKTYAGTDNTLEEAGSSSWTDRTRAVGGAYTCGTEDRWSFATFGNIVLASNVADVMQAATIGSSAFADISGAPQAKYIAVSDGFVMAVNTSTSSDQWHCSAYNDHTDWTEAVSTQCTSGRLLGGGELTGVFKLGSGFVAFKKNATYVANYVGAPVVFDWEPIPGDIGCPSGHAGVLCNDRIAFLGNDDFYLFDGATHVSLGQGIREWFFEDADNTYLHRAIASYNPVTANVTWYYVSKNAGGIHPDKAVIYNMRTGKWGKTSQQIYAAATYYPAGVIIDGASTDLADLYSTIDDMTSISFDSPYWSSGTPNEGYIGTDNILYTLTGTPGDSYIVMNTFGDDDIFSTVRQVRPRFLTATISSTVDYFGDDTYGDTFTAKGTYQLVNGKYDLLHSSRWHRIKFNFTRSFEIVGARIDVVQDGTK